MCNSSEVCLKRCSTWMTGWSTPSSLWKERKRERGGGRDRKRKEMVISTWLFVHFNYSWLSWLCMITIFMNGWSVTERAICFGRLGRRRERKKKSDVRTNKNRGSSWWFMSHWFQEAVVNLSVEFSLFPTVYVNGSPLNAFFFQFEFPIYAVNRRLMKPESITNIFLVPDSNEFSVTGPNAWWFITRLNQV